MKVEPEDAVGETVHWEDAETGERKSGVVEDVGPMPYFWMESGVGIPVDYIEEYGRLPPEERNA